MRLWSLQDPAVAKTLASGRVHRAVWKFTDKDFRASYRWMVEQMKQRGLDTRGRPPVWAYHSWEEPNRRPDIRTLWSYVPQVRLTLDLPDKQALLSDYSMWHIPLGRDAARNVSELDYLPLNEADDEAAAARWAAGRLSKQEILNSWARIFDIQTECPYWGNPFCSIQACLTQIRPEWVVKMERFNPRKDRVRPVYQWEK